MSTVSHTLPSASLTKSGDRAEQVFGNCQAVEDNENCCSKEAEDEQDRNRIGEIERPVSEQKACSISEGDDDDGSLHRNL